MKKSMQYKLTVRQRNYTNYVDLTEKKLHCQHSLRLILQLFRVYSFVVIRSYVLHHQQQHNLPFTTCSHMCHMTWRIDNKYRNFAFVYTFKMSTHSDPPKRIESPATPLTQAGGGGSYGNKEGQWPDDNDSQGRVSGGLYDTSWWW